MYKTFNPYMSVESVGHQFKLAIRRDKRNSTVILKSGQADTLVKFNIL